MARRRRTIVLIAAALTLLAGVVAVGLGVVWIDRTASGADFARGFIVRALTGMVQGRVHVGTVHGRLLGAPVIDSLEIRDADDSVLVATGPVSFEFDLLDLWDKRIVLRNVVVARPFVHLRRDTAGAWNYRRALRSSGSPPRPPGARSLTRKLGDIILLDTVVVTGGEFRWTEPWTPDARLRGAARDSAIAFNLERPDADIERWGRRFLRVRHWRDLRVEAPSIRVKHPDSDDLAVR